jgi:peroxiredoxin
MTKLLVDQPAPQFTLPDLNGKMIGPANYLGKIVLLNFWSAECPISARADAVIRGWGDQVAVLTIASNANEAAELLRRVAAERGIAPVLLDPEQQAADLYGAETTPHLFLIDAAGVLRYQGALDDQTLRRRSATRFYLMEAVEALLSGAAVAQAETPAYGCTIVRNYEE